MAPKKTAKPPETTTAPKIELRSVKYVASMTRETNCFTATIFVDGKREGSAFNDGGGGQTIIEPHSLRARLEKHAATLPRVQSDMVDRNDPSGFYTFQPDAESLVDSLVEEHLTQREDARLLRSLERHVMFTREGSAAVYQVKATPEALARMRHDPAALASFTAQRKADRVLNFLPRDEALAAIRAGAAKP